MDERSSQMNYSRNGVQPSSRRVRAARMDPSQTAELEKIWQTGQMSAEEIRRASKAAQEQQATSRQVRSQSSTAQTQSFQTNKVYQQNTRAQQPMQEVTQQYTPVKPASYPNTAQDATRQYTPVTPASYSNAVQDATRQYTPVTSASYPNAVQDATRQYTPVAPASYPNAVQDATRQYTPVTPASYPNAVQDVTQQYTPVSEEKSVQGRLKQLPTQESKSEETIWFERNTRQQSTEQTESKQNISAQSDISQQESEKIKSSKGSKAPAKKPTAKKPPEKNKGGITKIILIILIFALFALVVCVGGVYFLYSRTDETSLPNFNVTLNGETLQTTSYDWNVSVIGDKLKREFSYNSQKVTELSEAIDSEYAVLNVDGDCDSNVTIQNEAGETIYDGSVGGFDNFALPGNGTYTGELVLSKTPTGATSGKSVKGTQTYQFSFDVSIAPEVRLSADNIAQGSILSVLVSGMDEDSAPWMDCGLDSTSFLQCSDGWVAYISIPMDAEEGTYDITIHTEQFDLNNSFTVQKTDWTYADYDSESERNEAFVDESDLPDTLLAQLSVSDPAIYWADTGFISPFAADTEVVLPYGMTEYVGRTDEQKAAGEGEGRTSYGVVIQGTTGEELVAPAAGRVLLAEDLGGALGNTIVIEHGDGLKSLFYNLQELSVSAEDVVNQGQVIATTWPYTNGEVRIGTVAVEPTTVWDNTCDALKTY